MKPHSRDSYQPSERGVQEKRCTRGGVGSIADGRLSGSTPVVLWENESINVRVVCKGKVGSQESI